MRAAWLALNDLHLANGLSCPPYCQKHLLATVFHHDLNLSLLDDVHGIPHITLADDGFAILVHLT
jgi:hypothetical protein